MNAQQSDLWKRLEAFPIDDSESEYPFSKRVARSNYWSPRYTARAITEYKRFLFLAMEAGHPVSPSDAVDQVWHEHLTYTRSYWDQLCGKVLGRPLHHEPTRGGKAETAKFHDWYEDTLASYRRLFEEEPPADLWPSSARRINESEKFARIDTSTHLILNRPQLSLRWLFHLCLLTVSLIAAGCRSEILAESNLFDLRGPEFLQLFWGTAFLVFGLAFFLRWYLRQPATGASDAGSGLDAYDIALLSGGRSRAVHAAIARLVDCEALKVVGPTRMICSTGTRLKHHFPLEYGILDVVVSRGETVKGIEKKVAPRLDTMQAELEKKGLLVSGTQRLLARLVPLALCLLLLLVGIVKVNVGLERHRPVELLILSCIAVGIVAVIAFARRPHRSRYGDQFIRNQKTDYKSRGSLTSQPGYADMALPLALGLFGYSALDSTIHKDLKNTFVPPGSSGCGSSGGDGGSGDGGSGCGGGGGCGGCGGGGGD